MSKHQTTDLIKFLSPMGDDVRDKVLWLREFIWDLYPTANEIIYDNYNALSIGWSVTERLSHVFCSIAAFRTNKNIHFGFYWGNQIDDPEKMLIGNGKQYRYILVKDKAGFPQAYIEKLMSDAYINSFQKVKDPRQLVEGLTITRSVSPVKRELKGTSKKKE